MPRQQTRFEALKQITVLAIRLTQVILFGVGTALVWLSNIRGKKLTPFRLFTTLARAIIPAEPAPTKAMPRLPRLVAATPALSVEPMLDVETMPVYAGYSNDKEEDTEVNKPEPVPEKPKTRLDPAFAGAMKSLGFAKVELQQVVSDITAQDLTGQIRQALKLLNKPTLSV